MQLKFSVDRTDRITLPVDGRHGRWILKIPKASRPGLARAEFAVMEWARAAGFQVPELAIVDPREVEGVPPDAVENIAEALLVRRFDRLEDYKIQGKGARRSAA
jgi:serine/threonine protein kinase HipA of HipAB toxin-antitoxin module